MNHLQLYEEFKHQTDYEKVMNVLTSVRPRFMENFKRICIVFDDEEYLFIYDGEVIYPEYDQISDDVVEDMVEYPDNKNFYEKLSEIFRKNVNYVLVKPKKGQSFNYKPFPKISTTTWL